MGRFTENHIREGKVQNLSATTFHPTLRVA